MFLGSFLHFCGTSVLQCPFLFVEEIVCYQFPFATLPVNIDYEKCQKQLEACENKTII